MRPGYRAEITPLRRVNRVLKGTVDSVAAGGNECQQYQRCERDGDDRPNLEWVRPAQRVSRCAGLDEQQGNLGLAGNTTATARDHRKQDRDAP